MEDSRVEGPPAAGPTDDRTLPGRGSAGFPRWFLPALGAVLTGAYCVFVLAPIVALVQAGWGIAGDPSEYLLTASQGLRTGPGELPYVFPAMPWLYTPVGVLNVPFGAAYAAADVLSGILAIGVAGAFAALGRAVGRSWLSAGVAGAAAGTFPAVLGEVGWGGQAQFLAILLGAVAGAVLLSEFGGRQPLRARLVAGLLLGGAALAEPYAAACLVLFALAATILMTGRGAVRLRALPGYVLLLAPAAAAVGFVTVRAGASSPTDLGSPVITYAGSPGGLGFILATLGFSAPWTALGYGLVLAAVVASLVLPPGGTSLQRSALIAAAVAFLLQALVVTPATYAPRAAAFFVLPLVVSVAILLSPTVLPVRRPESSAPAPARRRWTLRGAARGRPWRWAAATIAVAIVLIQVGLAWGSYPANLKFNEFNAAAIAQLTWLRDQGGSVMLVAPETLTFPVAFATERPLFPAVQPFWFDTPEERSAAVLACTVASGAEWLGAGPLEVVGTGPAGRLSSPSVYVYESADLIKVATVVAVENGVRSPGVRPGTAATGARPASNATLPGAFALPTYNVSTLASVELNGTVVVHATFAPTGASDAPVRFGLAFTDLGLSDVRLAPSSGTAVATFQESGGASVALSLDVGVAGGPGDAVTSGTLNTSGTTDDLTWNVTPPASGPFNVTVSLAVPGLTVSPATLVAEATALASAGIRWAVIDTATNASAIPRFELDGLFAPAQITPTFEVFRVV